MANARIVSLNDINEMRKITNSIACMARVASDLRIQAETMSEEIETGPSISGINDGIELLADMAGAILDKAVDSYP